MQPGAAERRVKRKLLVIAIALTLLVIAARAGARYMETSLLPAYVEDATRTATGTPARITGKISLAFFPPTINIGAMEWHSSLAGEASASVRHIRIVPEIRSLFFGNPVLAEVFLEKPVVNMGNYNPREGGIQKDQMTPAGIRKNLLPVDINRLMIQDGAFSFRRGDKNIQLDKINLSAENLRPRGDAEVKCDFTIIVRNGATRAGIEDLNGNLAFKTRLSYYHPNLTFRQGSATFTALSGEMAQWLSPLRLTFEGAIDLGSGQARLNTANLESPSASLSLRGEGNIFNPVFTGAGALEIVRAGKGAMAETMVEAPVISSGIKLRNHDVTLDEMVIKIGEAQGSGKGLVEFPHDGIPLSIKGELFFGKIRLDSIFNVVETCLNPAAKAAKTRKASVPAQVAPEWPKIDITCDFASLGLGKIFLDKARFMAKGEGGSYRLADIGFDLAGGNVQGEMKADLTGRDLALEMRGAKIDMGKLLAPLGFRAVSGGRLTFATRLEANGLDFKAIRESLRGNGVIQAENARIVGLSEIAGMFSLFRSKTTASTGEGAGFKADFTASDGLIVFPALSLNANGLSGIGRVTINLPREEVDGRINLKTMGLNIPLTFKGPFNNINLGVDSRFSLDLGF